MIGITKVEPRFFTVMLVVSVVYTYVGIRNQSRGMRMAQRTPTTRSAKSFPQCLREKSMYVRTEMSLQA